MTHIQEAQWLPDSKSVVVLGSEPSKPTRHYRVLLSGGAPVPVLPEGVVSALFAPDGKTAVGVTTDGGWALYPVDGGAARPLAALEDSDEPFAFSEDGRAVFVQRTGLIPAVVDRIDLSTGKRRPSDSSRPRIAPGLSASTSPDRF